MTKIEIPDDLYASLTALTRDTGDDSPDALAERIIRDHLAHPAEPIRWDDEWPPTIEGSYRWHFSGPAIRDYLRIARLPNDNQGPMWKRAERELGHHAERATFRRLDPDFRGGEVWQTGSVRVGGLREPRRLLLYLTTRTINRGPLPTLRRVQVR